LFFEIQILAGNPVLGGRRLAVTDLILEHFVDAETAGKFLSLNRRRILELARAGQLPGHPIGDGARRVWRFRLSEIAAAITAPATSGLASGKRASMVRRPKASFAATGTEG
jgi:hypothetical protein